MARRHRRHSTQLKLQLARAYLNGEGSFKAIAKQHDILKYYPHVTNNMQRIQVFQQPV